MPEYDITFAKRLSASASLVAQHDLQAPEAKRTVLYLSLLATEIAMKAMLEKAGIPVSKIRARSHDLAGLTRDLGRCKVEVEVSTGVPKMVPATRIRAFEVQSGAATITVGKILDAEAAGASKYPNQVRYGPLLRHFPADVVAAMSARVVAFAEEHWASLAK